MKSLYVSEFTRFINRYLAQNPDVVEDQKRGWRIYWDRQVDPVALEEAEEDSVPFDAYEFNPAVRHPIPSRPHRH